MNESGFIAEGYARESVPDDQLGSGRRVFFIVAGALCGLPAYVLSAQVVNGLGFDKARYAFLMGGAIAGTLGALSAYVGAMTRMNLAMLADEAFGTTGGRIVKSLIALSLVGWVGVILSVLGATVGGAIKSLYGWNLNAQWIAVAAGLAVAVITLKGVMGLEYIGLVIAPLLCALLAWTFYKGCASSIGPRLSSAGATLGFGAAVSAVAGEYVVGIVIQPDYGRFVRRPLGRSGGLRPCTRRGIPCHSDPVSYTYIPVFGARPHKRHGYSRNRTARLGAARAWCLDGRLSMLVLRILKSYERSEVVSSLLGYRHFSGYRLPPCDFAC